MGRLRKGELPRHRPHKGSKRGVVTLGGKDFYTGPWINGEPSKEAAEAYNRLMAEYLANGQNVPARNAGITIAALCGRYVKFAQRYYSKHGQQSSEVPRIERVCELVSSLYGSLAAAEFTKTHFKTVRHAWVSAGLCRNTVNAQANLIKRMFRWAANEDLVPASVWTELTAVPGLAMGRSEAKDYEPTGPVEEWVAEETKKHLPRKWRDLIDVQLAAAMRPGEAVRLRMRDIDTTRADGVWIYRPTHPKTGLPDHKTAHLGKRCEIPLGPRAQAILERRAKDVINPNHYLFHRRDTQAKPTTIRSYRLALMRAIARANRAQGQGQDAPGPRRQAVPHWHPHQLRHLAGQRIRELEGLDSGQAVLRHEKVNMSEHYSRISTGKAADVMRRIG